MDVEGVARSSPGDTPEMVAAMVAAFQPGTVPIVSRHDGGVLLGYLDLLFRDDYLDLHFLGHVDVDVDADVAGRLRDGIPVSIEAVEAGPAPSEGRPGGEAWLRTKAHWLGALHNGWNLVGVSLSDNPAAPGSMLRTATPAPLSALYWQRDAEGRRTRWSDMDWQQRRSILRPRDRETRLTERVG